MTDDELLRENEKLRKINRVLMGRVERSTDAQGNAFSLFQAAITLEKTVQVRTVELQALNRQLHAAKTEADRANQSKTKFFAAASHDLQQPLNIARLYLGVLETRDLDAESARIAERIDAALASAHDLLATLLEMSRFDAAAMHPQPSDFPIDDLLRRVANDYALAASDRGLRLRVRPCAEFVRTDAQLLDRLLRNFISNALRYTARGGVLIGCRRRAGNIRIEVWDTGFGIPENRFADIFEEFRQLDVPDRAKHGGVGLGLGLSIVDRIARLLDLHVSVRSREGRGSVFAVDVPAGDPASARRAGGRAPSQRSGVVAHSASLRRVGRIATSILDGKTILLIDDDATALDGMATILAGWGCRTIAAQTVASAIELTARDVCPDLIVADYHLGCDRTGLEAIDSVRAAFDRDVTAVVVTADRSDETRARVTERGHFYLNKPVPIARLHSLMNHALA